MGIMVCPIYLHYWRWKTPKYGSTGGFIPLRARVGTDLPIERRCTSMPNGNFASAKMRKKSLRCIKILKTHLVIEIEF